MEFNLVNEFILYNKKLKFTLKESIILLIFAMLLVMSIHFKTGKVIELAITWGIISFILFLQEGAFIAITLAISGFIVTWSLFSLANYFEESIFLRLMVLIIGMGAMLIVPFLIIRYLVN